jgi:hypothetical protein
MLFLVVKNQLAARNSFFLAVQALSKIIYTMPSNE